MKITKILLFTFLCFSISCKKYYTEKPENLVDPDQMEEMLYDLAILDGLKNQNPTEKQPSPTQYIQAKYQIDSITFAKNLKYYATNIKEYRKMYEKIKTRLAEQKDKALVK